MQHAEGGSDACHLRGYSPNTSNERRRRFHSERPTTEGRGEVVGRKAEATPDADYPRVSVGRPAALRASRAKLPPLRRPSPPARKTRGHSAKAPEARGAERSEGSRGRRPDAPA